jgi:hypothetical protein
LRIEPLTPARPKGGKTVRETPGQLQHVHTTPQASADIHPIVNSVYAVTLAQIRTPGLYINFFRGS